MKHGSMLAMRLNQGSCRLSYILSFDGAKVRIKIESTKYLDNFFPGLTLFNKWRSQQVLKKVRRACAWGLSCNSFCVSWFPSTIGALEYFSFLVDSWCNINGILFLAFGTGNYFLLCHNINIELDYSLSFSRNQSIAINAMAPRISPLNIAMTIFICFLFGYFIEWLYNT